MPTDPDAIRKQKADINRKRYHDDPVYRERAKDSVKNKIKAGDGDPRHGKLSSYTNHGCRCDLCTKTASEDSRRRRQHDAETT